MFAFSCLLIVGCGEIIADPPTLTPEFNYHPYENEAAFDMLYPTIWSFTLIQEGLLAFAESDALNLATEELDASLVVFRDADPVRFTLAEDLQHYLDGGPLDAGFVQVENSTKVVIQGVESKSVVVVRDSAENPAQAIIVMARSRTGITYTFTATAPQYAWDFWWPHFQVMLSSVEFNE